MGQDNHKDSNGTGFDLTRAQLFDALGHPIRIRILEVLSQKSLSFSDLKREVGIESSGHLTFHLGKLNDLVRTDPSGAYELTDDGREALHLVRVMSSTSSPANAANAIKGGRSSGKRSYFFATRRRKTATVTAVLAIIILFLFGIAVSSGIVFYSSQETMNWNYLNWSPSDPWHTVHFNDTKSDFISDFNFNLNLAGVPAISNQTMQTIPMGIQIAHEQGTYLDSLQVQFVASDSSYCCFVLEQVASEGVGANPAVPTQLTYSNGVFTFNIQNFGFIGTESVTIDLLLGLSRLSQLANVPAGNNSLVMSIQLKMHSTGTVLIGHDYLGEASVPLNIMPNGLISLAKTNS